MDRDEGLHILSTRGWLADVPATFGSDLLAEAHWRHVDRGEQVSLAGDEGGDPIGLAEGYVAFHVSFGPPGSPILHMTPPVFRFGYRTIVAGDTRIATGIAMSPVACATIPQRHVRGLPDARPAWWRHMMPLTMNYGDTAATIASDLLIPDAEARLVAELLRFAGLRRPCAGDAAPVVTAIDTSFNASDRTYGARRVWHDVLEEGLICGLHRIERLMRQNALKARPKRRGRPQDDGERSVTADNILADFLHVPV